MLKMICGDLCGKNSILDGDQMIKAKALEIVCGRYNDDSILKEQGPLGRFLFKIKPYPGLKGDGKIMLDMIKAAPILLNACREALDYLEGQMDEAEKLEHEFDGHEICDCPICVLRDAIKKAE